ncbi:hypothetical protein [Brevibacterium moorei]|uniref:hypothetical protein n=1 Tax=Brevibacterium moorei TaxID=2968457 RepID=UPI00211CAF65|nr:hypothetical protein [Brevibacterium sp. 68QC2CO]MCQ9384414.1 hypothetical protein [Brevibacterium sp. 68QC2CO]
MTPYETLIAARNELEGWYESTAVFSPFPWTADGCYVQDSLGDVVDPDCNHAELLLMLTAAAPYIINQLDYAASIAQYSTAPVPPGNTLDMAEAILNALPKEARQ